MNQHFKMSLQHKRLKAANCQVFIISDTRKSYLEMCMEGFLSASLGRACASTDHSFFVSGLSSIVAQRDEYLSAH